MPAQRPQNKRPGPGLAAGRPIWAALGDQTWAAHKAPYRAFRRPLGWALAALGALLAFWAALGAFPDPLATAEWPWTVNIVDRHYRPLAKIPGPNGYRDAKELADFSPTLIAAVLAAEDRRFYWHLGFDPLAAARALGQNLAAQKVVRGGSTVTAQLARLSLGLYPGPRTLRRKLKEFWTALLIERHHDKDEILAAYLNAVPTGPFRWGLATAARDYLGKDAALLSPAEAAFLAALPKNPNQTDLDKLRNRQKWILGRLKDQGFLSEADRQRALVEALSPISPQNPYLAPHFVARLRQAATAAAGPKANPGQPLRSSLDLELQTQAQRLVSETVAAWSRQGLTQAAVVVLSLPDREVLAWVGSADFFDRAEGQNDGVLALRQPGSALKPFIYQQALEEGLITAATLLNDEPTSYDGGVGSFTPRNYGEGFHGRIPARVALASSLNVPAVQLLNALGPGKAIRRLNSLGFSFKEDADLYGLGLTLGAGEVSLLALTNAYATLALGGRDGQPTFRPGPENPAGSLDLDPGASFIVNHILADDEARAVGFGRRGVLATSYPSSVKTGTSQNFRDNWAVGFTDGFIVGVWAGNFQARPMSEVSGVTGAGRLWRRLADYLAQKKPPKPLKVPPGVVKASVCPITGLLKGPNCPNGVSEYFLAQSLPPGVCDHDHEPNAGRGLRPSPPPVFASSQSPALMAQWLSPRQAAAGSLPNPAPARDKGLSPAPTRDEGLNLGPAFASERRSSHAPASKLAKSPSANRLASDLPPNPGPGQGRGFSPTAPADLKAAPPTALKLLTPRAWEVYAYDPGIDPAFQNLEAAARVGPGVDRLRWLLNGEILAEAEAEAPLARLFFPLTPGQQRLTVLALRGGQVVSAAEARFLVK